MTEVWFDKHPPLADLILLTLPSFGVFSMWMIMGLSIKDSIIQAILTGGLLLIAIMYLNKKHDNSVFRFFDI